MSEVTTLELMEDAPDNFTIRDSLGKCQSMVKVHKKIMVGVSGGADSDNMTDMIIRCGGKEKSTFVFYNTGLETKATKRHLVELEQKYGIEIQIIPPVKPIPICVKQHGVPFWSKRASEMIMRLQKHGFQWEDEPLEVLLKKYPRCRTGVRWWCNDHKKDNGDPSALNIEWAPYLKEFMIANPPTFPIANKCCHYAKKEPARLYEEAGDFDMTCTGVRKAEGGYRATGITSCYTQALAGADAYRPLFWYTDADRAEYENHYGVEHSDCYKVWGMTRTGCAGCPYGKEFEQELELLKKYEPNFYKAAVKIFGQSYEYTRKYLAFREEMKKAAKAQERDQGAIEIA